MSTVPTHCTEDGRGPAAMRGRAAEWSAVLDLLAAAQEGRSGVLLVEGEPGIGKSLLLREATRTARARGVLSVTVGAPELGRMPLVESLLSALGEDVIADGEGPSAEQDRHMWRIERVRAGLDERAGAGPVLVSLDDLQLVTPTALATLRAWTSQLAGRPVAWLLARSTVKEGKAAGRLFGLLEYDGVQRVILPPLDDEALTWIVIDMLGAVPDARLAALARQSGGNPYLLTALIAGLRGENGIQIRDGSARLVAAGLPRRSQAAARHLLDQLSPRTRHLLTVAAVLARSFSPDAAAAVLGATPTAIVPQLDEALSAGVLAVAGEELAFRHGLLWQAVTDAVPVPIRKALHQQIGEVLYDRGGPATAAAAHLMQGVRTGDPRGLAELDRLVDDILPVSPHTAADIALRVVHLTGPAEPARTDRTLTAVRTLMEAGRLDEAAGFTEAALTRPLTAAAHARLCCLRSEILHMQGRSAEAAADAATVLAQPGLPNRLRDAAELALLNAQVAARDGRLARRHAQAIVEAAGEHGDALVTGAFITLALAAWDMDDLAEGLRLAREAVSRAASIDAWCLHPRMILAMLLTDVRRLDEACSVMASAGDDVKVRGRLVWAAAPAVLRARLHLAAGRFDDAIAEAEAGLAATSGSGPHVLMSSALAVLAVAALRSGGPNAAQRYVDRVRPGLSQYGSPHAEARFALVTSQIAMARDGAGAVARAFAELCEQVPEHSWALVSDPTAAAWLVRTALALDDRLRAESVVGAAERLARENPGFPTVAAAAEHARGLLDGDECALDRASADHADPWARASAAEDLGALAASRGTGSRQSAIASLDQALAGYDGIGAAWDAARVRRRLRRLGVRRRHWTQGERPVSGWGSLTDTERRITELVAQGLTNRQVADQLFISVHTTAFHLRHIFRKLEIGSRFELARRVMEENRQQTPSDARLGAATPVSTPPWPG
ncbi:helix-turn-helix transcriptional regulator [Actinoallomurus soli]|uniref:helix-turn-helix transcriptional regulator n=1 Tax=Actinoallomurus soli TaxID=2952535 RepID=UPI002093671D|nr:LuxR family transcriptional regulator [Actinoallomurus soli]MCO5974084.1 LuxR C-terminal-related transcriptional regulator [Actinoallomurus soli]